MMEKLEDYEECLDFLRYVQGWINGLQFEKNTSLNNWIPDGFEKVIKYFKEKKKIDEVKRIVRDIRKNPKAMEQVKKLVHKSQKGGQNGKRN